MVDGSLLRDRTVLIADCKIVAIQDKDVPLKEGIRTIAGTGKFLAPGLADMHVHIWNEKEPSLYVSYGVTTVRNMWGEEMTLHMRDRITSGEIVGPRVVTAVRIVDGAP